MEQRDVSYMVEFMSTAYLNNNGLRQAKVHVLLLLVVSQPLEINLFISHLGGQTRLIFESVSVAVQGQFSERKITLLSRQQDLHLFLNTY